jgi:hypothetical protein
LTNNYSTFYPKNYKILSLTSQKYGLRIWDKVSEVWDPEKTYSGTHIPDPGIKKATDPRSVSATLVTTGVKQKIL